MTPVAQVGSEALPLEGLESPPELGPPDPAALCAADMPASELLVRLGHEYFSVEVMASTLDSKNVSDRPSVNPGEIAKSCPPSSEQRDFWEEVAATSEKAATWPAAALGALGPSRDPVAFAIATVSASYTLAASEKRIAAPPVVVGSATPPPTPKDANKASGDVHKQPHTAEPTFADALASLFGLEELAELAGVRELDPDVFTRARELAAHAVVAAATNRHFALKSAGGRRG